MQQSFSTHWVEEMLLIVLFLIITAYVLCSVLCVVCVLCRIISNKKALLKGNSYYTVRRLHAHLQHSGLKSAWKLFTHPFCSNNVGRNRILPSKENKAAYCHTSHLDHSMSCGGSTETVRRSHLSSLEKSIRKSLSWHIRCIWIPEHNVLVTKLSNTLSLIQTDFLITQVEN